MGKLTKAELRAQLEAALANYKGPVTHCPPGTPPNEDAEQREQRKFDRALREITRLSLIIFKLPKRGGSHSPCIRELRFQMTSRWNQTLIVR